MAPEAEEPQLDTAPEAPGARESPAAMLRLGEDLSEDEKHSLLTAAALAATWRAAGLEGEPSVEELPSPSPQGAAVAVEMHETPADGAGDSPAPQRPVESAQTPTAHCNGQAFAAAAVQCTPFSPGSSRGVSSGGPWESEDGTGTLGRTARIAVARRHDVEPEAAAQAADTLTNILSGLAPAAAPIPMLVTTSVPVKPPVASELEGTLATVVAPSTPKGQAMGYRRMGLVVAFGLVAGAAVAAVAQAQRRR